MKTSEYLDAVRAELVLPSDYALQKPLSLSKQQIGRYRKNLDFFSDEVCQRVGVILKKHPGLIMIDMHRARAQSDEVRRSWDEIFRDFPAPLLRADRTRARPPR